MFYASMRPPASIRWRHHQHHTYHHCPLGYSVDEMPRHHHQSPSHPGVEHLRHKGEVDSETDLEPGDDDDDDHDNDNDDGAKGTTRNPRVDRHRRSRYYWYSRHPRDPRLDDEYNDIDVEDNEDDLHYDRYCRADFNLSSNRRRTRAHHVESEGDDDDEHHDDDDDDEHDDNNDDVDDEDGDEDDEDDDVDNDDEDDDEVEDEDFRGIDLPSRTSFMMRPPDVDMDDDSPRVGCTASEHVRREASSSHAAALRPSSSFRIAAQTAKKSLASHMPFVRRWMERAAGGTSPQSHGGRTNGGTGAGGCVGNMLQ